MAEKIVEIPAVYVRKKKKKKPTVVLLYMIYSLAHFGLPQVLKNHCHGSSWLAHSEHI